MIINLYLLEQALKVNSIDQLEAGVQKINEILLSEIKQDFHKVYKNQDFWNYDTGVGKFIEFTYSIVKSEYQALIRIIFERISSIDQNFNTKQELDNYFSSPCNGFVGFNFENLYLNSADTITNISEFESFTKRSLIKNINSIDDFWNLKNQLFPNLIFCYEVLNDISNYGIKDDRFLQISKKLSRLNDYANRWSFGKFENNEIGSVCTPETPSRLRRNSNIYTKLCPDGKIREFSLHIKLSVGSDLRIFIYPCSTSYDVYIGFIKHKKDLGY